MPTLDWKRLVKKNELFSSLSDVEVEQLIDPETAEEKSYTTGDQIIRHGERGRNFFLIGKGSVNVTTPGPDGCDIDLAILEAGEFFGEMSLLRQQPRTATASAREECTVLRISAAKLRALLNQRPDILAGIFILLSERMRDLADRVISVSYHEVNSKLELFSAKLDAELKAMNSTLAATQTVFEQTTTRANEVINSTERHWTRMTVIGSVATTIMTLVVGGFAWFGIKNYDDFTKVADNAKANITKVTADYQSEIDVQLGSFSTKAKVVDDKVSEIEATAKEAKALTDKLRIEQATLQSGATYSVVPILEKLTSRNAKGAQYYIPILQSNLRLMLSGDQEDSVTVFFRELYSWIITDDSDSVDRANRPRQVVLVLSNIVDARKGMPVRNQALAYYFLLTNLAITGRYNEYDIRLNELDRELRSQTSPAILKDDIENFDPEGFILAIEPQLESADDVEKLRARIMAAWQKISGA